jgi:hypothetical protein
MGWILDKSASNLVTIPCRGVRIWLPNEGVSIPSLNPSRLLINDHIDYRQVHEAKVTALSRSQRLETSE